MATHTPVIIDELFGELEPASGEELWAVVHTKPRCEKKLAEYAFRNSITYYLPQMESKRLYQRRLVTTTKPMFPGYLFCVLDAVKKQKLLVSGLTVSFIKVNTQKELLDDLINIQLTRHAKMDMEPIYWLSEGLQVEITKGPLKGLIGVVESHDKIGEVRLQVDILRQAVMIKIDPQDVKIISKYEIVNGAE